MNLELLNLIISLCTGAADPQACQKRFAVCHDNKVALEEARSVACRDKDNEAVAFSKCMKTSGGERKYSHALIGECLKE